MKNVVHHARLKNILEKLIVVDGSASFDFEHPPLDGGVGVGVETLQNFAFAPKQHGDDYFVVGGLSFLDTKSDRFQAWAQPGHDDIAMLASRRTRIDAVGQGFEESDDTETEFRGR
jgi:hypothetical protein